ncbi:protein disulfide oxidoreductase [Vibrio sp. SCSIO 43136]|uniref:protein disulfide oxidoreductase n=1 Tax=Vibrio sp. SCSIO 43136 TaxID=2819101 RepID=UPI002075017F|nr:protein disulfide oxidoreductase [Vibrio sp. SCSIO 43136]USD66082.1 protein disulfide oxidoreductase [Vibrio sp. SCSIO 43136]
MATKKTRSTWAKDIALWLLMVTLVSAGLDWWRKQSMPEHNLPSLMQLADEQKVVDILAISQERPVVVYFWATWCGVCNFVSPSIDWLSEQSDFEVVGVSLSSGSAQRVSHYMQTKGYEFNNINDPAGEISSQWGISATPTIAVIRSGEITSVTTGITTPIGLFARAWLAK